MTLLIGVAIGVVALLYASVGHGGASGYLAVLALSGGSPAEVRATALLLNVLVSAVALRKFAGSANVRWALLARFASTAAPCAFIAGAFGAMATGPFYIAVALALLFAAWRMALPSTPGAMNEVRPIPGLFVTLPIGACIGIVSGLIGVGGGIFLSPLLLIGRWSTPHETAAISAAFILLSSVAGLIGVVIQYGGIPAQSHDIVLYLATSFVGGFVGASLGSGRFNGQALRRALAVILALAAFKLLMKAQ